MKLSAKFARQESEQQRLERIARKRVSGDRAEAVRRMLGLDATDRKPRRTARPRGADAAAPRQLPCPECDRRTSPPPGAGSPSSRAGRRKGRTRGRLVWRARAARGPRGISPPRPRVNRAGSVRPGSLSPGPRAPLAAPPPAPAVIAGRPRHTSSSRRWGGYGPTHARGITPQGDRGGRAGDRGPAAFMSAAEPSISRASLDCPRGRPSGATTSPPRWRPSAQGGETESQLTKGYTGRDPGESLRPIRFSTTWVTAEKSSAPQPLSMASS